MCGVQDPLTVMPLLIPCRSSHAVPVIRVVSERANAKEILLVLQEILERLSHGGEQGDEDEQDDESEELSPTLQLERAVFSYAYGKSPLCNLPPRTPHLIGHQFCRERCPRKEPLGSVSGGHLTISENISWPWSRVLSHARVKQFSTP